MQRPGDLLIEEDVAHRVEDVGIEAEGEFARVARSGVGVENRIQAFGVVARGGGNLPVFELQADILELGP